jgi:hypothetical protein
VSTHATAPEDRPQHPQTYRVEVRFDFTGTQEQAEAAARRAAALVGGEVTAIFDEDWNEVDATLRVSWPSRSKEDPSG